MKRVWLAMLLLAAVLAGCSGAAGGGDRKPKAVAPVTEYNFGDVLTTEAVKTKEFQINNEGTADLKILDAQVKLLEGCWPPRVTVGSTVVKPGKSTSFVFPYHMGPGMGGPHYFQVKIKTNDPATPELVFHVRANSVDPK